MLGFGQGIIQIMHTEDNQIGINNVDICLYNHIQPLTQAVQL